MGVTTSHVIVHVDGKPSPKTVAEALKVLWRQETRRQQEQQAAHDGRQSA